jgi:YD repeat-containing protein
MAIKFDRYRFVDGRTPLSAAVFNAVFRDLDLRTGALEDKGVDWDAAVGVLTDQGLERIDNVLGPILQQVQDQADTFAADGLQQINDSILPVLADAQSTLTQLEQDANTAAQVVSALDPYPSVAITYDGEGRIDTVTATYTDETQQVQTMTYDVDGKLTTVTSVLNGQTQTLTISYDESGLVTGLVTELTS